jgi:hypothetical protein
MKKFSKVMGIFLLGVALLGVCTAWFEAWREHRREVERQRLVWGPKAEVKWFDLRSLVVPGRMPRNTEDLYLLAGPFAVAGILFLVFSARIKAQSKPEKGALPAARD